MNANIEGGNHGALGTVALSSCGYIKQLSGCLWVPRINLEISKSTEANAFFHYVDELSFSDIYQNLEII